MKKNLYYRTVFKRRNLIKEFIYNLFTLFFSVPRLLLEVFIRKNFGERYFSFSTGVLVTIFLFPMPLAHTFGFRFIPLNRFNTQFDILDFLLHSLTWYLFLAAFIAMCIDRRSEIKRLPSVFDFGRQSHSTGRIHPGFLKYQPYGKPLSIRTIETLIEPGFFLAIGLALCILQQKVGVIIVFCSICYSISYIAAYHQGDEFIMDQIDEMIYNEELTASFIEGLAPNETRGVNYYGRKPSDPAVRRRLAENFTEDDDIAEAR